MVSAHTSIPQSLSKSPITYIAQAEYWVRWLYSFSSVSTTIFAKARNKAMTSDSEKWKERNKYVNEAIMSLVEC